MKTLSVVLDSNSGHPLYLQLYDHIKKEVLQGHMQQDEKLPSIRELSRELGVSVTTVELAYSQLSVEGYLANKPRSGFYVGAIGALSYRDDYNQSTNNENPETIMSTQYQQHFEEISSHMYDLSCFDFTKWKKCSAKVYTEYPHLLLFEGDPQGEQALRFEIAKYVYGARGIIAGPEQIVIGAGTQQITVQLSRILSKMGINHVAVEEPGYIPVRNIFRDNGFLMTPVAVREDGIDIDRLPSNIPSAVYVSPSNQFPTGAVMPIGKRHSLLGWADHNDSIIIEDDYDSELRYFGKPIPAMQGLDTKGCVVYLGSFSSTLFSAIKISYMILPKSMACIFKEIKGDYSQTCSKAEQLTLSLFMEKGMYQTGIKKMRSLYAQKLNRITDAIEKYGAGFITAVDTASGINIILKVKSPGTEPELCALSSDLGLSVTSMKSYTSRYAEESDIIKTVILHYNQIPLDQIDKMVKSLIEMWKSKV